MLLGNVTYESHASKVSRESHASSKRHTRITCFFKTSHTNHRDTGGNHTRITRNVLTDTRESQGLHVRSLVPLRV